MCKEQYSLIPKGEISLLEIRLKTEHQGVLREVRKNFSFFVCISSIFSLILIENNIAKLSNACKIGKFCKSLEDLCNKQTSLFKQDIP